MPVSTASDPLFIRMPLPFWRSPGVHQDALAVLEIARRDSLECLQYLHVRLHVAHVASAVDESTGLVADGLHHSRVTVSYVQGSDACHKVQVLAALEIVEVHPFAPLEGNISVSVDGSGYGGLVAFDQL
jgi:hypothetical protein